MARWSPISGDGIRAYLLRSAVAIERHREYLTRLDAVLGDGDHGDNMAIGFQAIHDLLDGYPAETSPGELLRAVGHRLATTVGGASGPLYGTALIEAGLVAGSAPALDWPLIARMLDAAATGLARRGRCVVGDKTILDTLRPAADAALAGDTLGHVLLRGMARDAIQSAAGCAPGSCLAARRALRRAPRSGCGFVLHPALGDGALNKTRHCTIASPASSKRFAAHSRRHSARRTPCSPSISSVNSWRQVVARLTWQMSFWLRSFGCAEPPLVRCGSASLGRGNFGRSAATFGAPTLAPDSGPLAQDEVNRSAAVTDAVVLPLGEEPPEGLLTLWPANESRTRSRRGPGRPALAARAGGRVSGCSAARDPRS